MPMVGTEKFDYTPAGIAAAKKKAKSTGKPMKKAAKKTAKRVAKKSSMVRKRGM
jgi:hypothetical protein